MAFRVAVSSLTGVLVVNCDNPNASRGAPAS